MAAYLVKRLVLSCMTLLVILFLSYLLLRLAPGDPTRSSMLGAGADAGVVGSDRGAFFQNDAMRKRLHLDRPIIVGFGFWLEKAVTRLDFGESASVDPGRPVSGLIAERLPVTLALNVWAVAICYLVALPAGVMAAARYGSVFDRVSELVFFTLYSLPVIWVGLLLQSLLCEGGALPVFPLKGIPGDDFLHLGIYQALWYSARYYVLPIVCLAYGSFAGLSRYTRLSMLEALSSDYIRTARAKGAGEGRVVWVHAFRNALITQITLFAGLLPSLVAGSVIVEHIFNIPGMGTLSLLALSSRDYPLQMALFAFAGTLTLLGIFLSDMLYLAADRRISLTGGR